MVPVEPLCELQHRDKAIKRLAKRFKIEVIRKSNIINVSCEASSPELAQQIVELALKYASDIHLRVNRTAGSYDFFASQTDRQSDELHQNELEMRTIKNSTGIAELNAQRHVHVQRIAELEDRRLLAQSTLKAAEAEATERRKTLAALPETKVTASTTGNPQTAAAKMREQLYALELKEQDISSRFQEDTFFVKQIREQVAAAKKVLKDEADPLQVTKSSNPAHQSMQSALLEIQAKLSAYKGEVASLDEQIAASKRELELFNENEIKLASLERQIDLQKVSHKKYAENRELARIDQALEQQNISNLNILQAPTRSVTPTNPKVILNLSFGFILAVFAAFGVVVISEMRQPSAVAVTADDWYAKTEEEVVPAMHNPARAHSLPVQPR